MRPLILVSLILVGCGSDDKSSPDTSINTSVYLHEAAVAYEGSTYQDTTRKPQPAVAMGSASIEGCSFTVTSSDLVNNQAPITVDGVTLAYKFTDANHSYYENVTGKVRRYLSFWENYVNAGISCNINLP